MRMNLGRKILSRGIILNKFQINWTKHRKNHQVGVSSPNELIEIIISLLILRTSNLYYHYLTYCLRQSASFILYKLLLIAPLWLYSSANSRDEKSVPINLTFNITAWNSIQCLKLPVDIICINYTEKNNLYRFLYRKN